MWTSYCLIILSTLLPDARFCAYFACKCTILHALYMTVNVAIPIACTASLDRATTSCLGGVLMFGVIIFQYLMVARFCLLKPRKCYLILCQYRKEKKSVIEIHPQHTNLFKRFTKLVSSSDLFSCLPHNI